MYKEYQHQVQQAAEELLGKAHLAAGDIFVVGCSTSEVAGAQIGSTPGPSIAAALVQGLLPVLQKQGVFLAAQCCEHLNRALVVEAEALKMHGLTQVNAIPQPKAGGSFATAAWQAAQKPVLVSSLQAKAGLDIGSTLIGMHLVPVAVPVRLTVSKIGAASLVAARSRPPYIGGERAVYNPALL